MKSQEYWGNPEIAKDWLEEKYWGENLTQKEIAKELNVNLKTVYN